ncbi:UNVERIFIED_CONTAM: uncharacterized protein DUF4846 [Acetivibrio alkalicellulosi]
MSKLFVSIFCIVIISSAIYGVFKLINTGEKDTYYQKETYIDESHLRDIESSEGERETITYEEDEDIIQVFKINPEGETIKERFLLPEGFERIAVEEGSFGNYLRNLPLKAHGSPVLFYDGNEKRRDVHEAVIDIDVGDRDLQQCADAVIRLHAEYFYAKGLYDRIHYNFTNGFKADYITWMEGNRIVVEGNNVYWVNRTGYSNEYESFRRYLDMVFAYAGTLSLSQELIQVSIEDMQIGDIFMKGDLPGHCVIVVDMAINVENGEKIFMIAQSYMPAQDMHILKNNIDDIKSPWYSLDFGEVLKTPEWIFYDNQLMRFDNID